jgi:hypothetical protein
MVNMKKTMNKFAMKILQHESFHICFLTAIAAIVPFKGIAAILTFIQDCFSHGYLYWNGSAFQKQSNNFWLLLCL